MNRKMSEFYSSPKTWDEEADVLIVGSGIAGFAAADICADHGDQVIILEKMPYFGGNSNLAGGGYACWDSKLKTRQRLGLGDDSWELHMQDTIAGGNRHNIPALVEAMVKGAPEGMDWIVDAGVPFKDLLVKVGCHTKYRTYQADVSGRVMMEQIAERSRKKGVELRLEHEVITIHRDGPDGSVLGLSVKNGDRIIRIFARKAVLIASGGFSNDVEFRTQFRPDLTASYSCSNHRGATGEMIRYAQAVGADTLHLAYIQLFPCASPKSGAVDRWAFYSYSSAGFGAIYVDRQGKRFVSELDGRDKVSDCQIQSGDAPTYCIMNEEICQRLGVVETEKTDSLKSGRIFAADTVEELETKLGLPAGSLTETVRNHNSYLANSRDLEFGKPVDDFMSSLEQGPFYGIPQWPSVHYTHGGIRIDENARVIDVLGHPIPNLYGAGEVCGGVHGSNRMGGHGLADCVVFGMIAGRGMAQEAVRSPV